MGACPQDGGAKRLPVPRAARQPESQLHLPGDQYGHGAVPALCPLERVGLYGGAGHPCHGVSGGGVGAAEQAPYGGHRRVCGGLCAALLFCRYPGGQLCRAVRQRYGGPAAVFAVRRQPVPVLCAGRAGARLLADRSAADAADADQGYLLCLRADGGIFDRAGPLVGGGCPCPQALFARLGQGFAAGCGGRGGVCQLGTVHGGGHPLAGNRSLRRQRGAELRRGAAGRRAPAAGHRAGRKIRRADVPDVPRLFYPQGLPAGRRRGGGGLHYAGGGCRVVRRRKRRCPPAGGHGVSGAGVLLCRAVSVPPDLVLL